MKNKRRRFTANYKSFAAFIICTFFSFAIFSQNWDINTLDKINSNSSEFGDNACKFLSHSVTPVVIGTPVTLFTIGVIKKDSALKMQSYYMAGTIAINSIFTYALKISVKRERPFVTYPFIEKKEDVSSYSFPSGHTSAAFAFATSLSLSNPKWYIIAPAYTYAAAVGYSRMYLGVHYPTDVLGGMLIGAGSAYLSWEIQKWIIKKQKARIRPESM